MRIDSIHWTYLAIVLLCLTLSGCTGITASPNFYMLGPAAPASANLNPNRTGPSMFEPVHGSAPDLTGLDRAALHPAASTPLRIAYTAMHGVGHRLVVQALARAGLQKMLDALDG